MFWFSLQLFTETFLILRIIQRDIAINVHRPLWGSVRYYFKILFKLEFSRQILEKFWSIKRYENLSSGSQLVPCGRTDTTQSRVAFRNFEKMPINDIILIKIPYRAVIYIYMCVYIHTCICICTHIYTYVYIHTCICIYRYICMHVFKLYKATCDKLTLFKVRSQEGAKFICLSTAYRKALPPTQSSVQCSPELLTGTLKRPGRETYHPHHLAPNL